MVEGVRECGYVVGCSKKELFFWHGFNSTMCFHGNHGGQTPC